MVHRNGRIGFGLVVVLLCVLGGGTLTIPLTRAEEPPVELNSPEVLRRILEQQVGKRVKIKLLSGQDLDGKVANVGTQAVVLSELSGMGFFDAAVQLDQVAVVVVRAHGK